MKLLLVAAACTFIGIANEIAGAITDLAGSHHVGTAMMAWGLVEVIPSILALGGAALRQDELDRQSGRVSRYATVTIERDPTLS